MSVTQLLIIASAFALVATALPDVDSSTPEFELAEAQSTEASFTEAQSLVQAQGSNACNDLAKTTEDEVNNNIKREQDMLNKLDRGQNCKSKGDDVVSKAKNEKSAADSAYNQAVRNLNSAKSASVNFGQSRFGSIRKGDCSVFFNSGAYRTADNNVKLRQNTVNQKKGAQDAAAKAVDAAYKTKAKMVADCQCAVAHNMEKMYSAAAGRAKNSNQAAWTKAAHLRCVIKGTPANKCQVPNMKTLSKPGLAAGVSKDKCACATEHNPVCSAERMVWTGCNTARNHRNEYLDRQHMRCAGDEAISRFRFHGCGGNNMRYHVGCKKVGSGHTKTVNGQCGHMSGEKLQYLDRLDFDCGANYGIQTLSVKGCGGRKKRYVAKCIKIAGSKTTGQKHTNAFLAKNKHLEYLDRSNGPSCGGQTVLRSFRFHGAGGNNFRYYFHCQGK